MAPFCEAAFIVHTARRPGTNMTLEGCFLLMGNDLAKVTLGKVGGGMFGRGIVSVGV